MTLTISDVISNISTIISVQFDGSNWSAWQPQMTNIITGVELMDVLDGTKTCQEQYITSTTGERSVSAEYKKWFQSNLCLKTCLMSTISPSLVTEIAQYSHAHEIWYVFLKRYTTISQSQSFQLRAQLDKALLVKHPNMAAYLQHIKTITTQLELASDPVRPSDLVFTVMKGLTSQYGALKTTIHARASPIPFDELTSLLISEEIHVQNEAAAAQKTHKRLWLLFKLRALTVNLTTSEGEGVITTHGEVAVVVDLMVDASIIIISIIHSTTKVEVVFRAIQISRAEEAQGVATEEVAQTIPITQTSCTALTVTETIIGPMIASSKVTITPNQVYAASTSGLSESNYFFDSAANNHSMNDMSNLSVHQRSYYGPESVQAADGKDLSIQHIGNGPSFEESSSQGPF